MPKRPYPGKMKNIPVMKTSPRPARKSKIDFMPDLNPLSVKSRLENDYPILINYLKQTSDFVQYGLNWRSLAKTHQCPAHEDWLIWLLLGGRGSGKTRTGAEWVRDQVAWRGKGRIALVAPTHNDAREVMLEGESGLLNIGYPAERPQYIPSRRRLEWPNGAVGYIFTAEDPDGLRGPQFDAAWADEFCAWAYPETTLSNLRLGLRIGDDPRLVITTTPKPIPALKRLMAMKGVLMSRGKTEDNLDALAPSFLAAMEEAYGGTRLGRQELNGEYLEDYAGALWSRSVLERCYTSNIPELNKIVVAIDPPVSSGARADSCGIVVVGRQGSDRSCRAYVLHDGTLQGLSPEGWARHAIELYYGWDADYIVAEVNQGGDLVTSVLRTVDDRVAVRKVHASKGKIARAEPVAALYEQGRVYHTARFPELEDELVAMATEAMKGSPDRADALVWAVTDLMLKTRTQPRIRRL